MLVLAQTASGQVVFNGVVQDSLKKPIAFASIIASFTEDENEIDAYTTTNSQGEFTLKINKESSQLLVWVTYRHTSYAVKKMRYSYKSQQVTVELTEQKNVLDEVILNAKKEIELKGDTLTYNVAGLKKEKDYTIEEVLRRIPGVTIEESGQIKYKDNPIKHLYINGVDLLEGRYNIATRGIPADAVEEVDIMQKHNHERINIGKRDSDDVAFNLKIKKDHSLVFGSVRGDVGAPLLTAKAEATPIYIKDTFQDIASVKVNNMGESLQYNGMSLTSGNYDLTSNLLNNLTILRAPRIDGSVISNRYWLDNESVSLTNDALLKGKRDLILKAGANYNFNDNQLETSQQAVFFFGQDSTVVNRTDRNRLTTNDYYAGLVQELNRDKLYFKNKITIKGQQSTGSSNIVQNDSPLDYGYRNKTLNLANLTSLKFNIRENVVDAGIYIEHTVTTENGTVTPAVFTTSIPGNTNLNTTQQQLAASQFNTGAFIGYDFKIGNVKNQLKQSINYRTESLETDLSQLAIPQPVSEPFPLTSDFQLNSLTTQTSWNTTIKHKKITISLYPSLQFINLDKREFAAPALNTKASYLFLQPAASLDYKFDHQWNATLQGNYTSRVSRFEQLFNALVLTDPTGLFRNPDAINETRDLSFSGFIAHTNILKGLIVSNRSEYRRSESDFTLSSRLDAAGQLQVDAVQIPNLATQVTNTTRLNKRFFKILKTEWSYVYNLFLNEQIFNGLEQNARNTSHAFSTELGIDNNTWYGITYKGLYNLGNSRAAGFNASNTFIKHDLILDLYTSDKSRINVGMESVATSFSSSDDTNSNTLFNMSFHYKPSNKLFLRASLNNIFNERFFSTAQSSANVISQSQFALRPRQFTIGLNYSL
jgi:hypothetical protein